MWMSKKKNGLLSCSIASFLVAATNDSKKKNVDFNRIIIKYEGPTIVTPVIFTKSRFVVFLEEKQYPAFSQSLLLSLSPSISLSSLCLSNNRLLFFFKKNSRFSSVFITNSKTYRMDYKRRIQIAQINLLYE